MAKKTKTKDGGIKARFDFGFEATKRLEEIAEKAGESRTNTVRNALRLYDWYLDQREQGYKLQLARPKDKYVREVDLLF